MSNPREQMKEYVKRNEICAIIIRNENVSRLHTFGNMTSTYDSIIVALMDHADKTNFQVE